MRQFLWAFLGGLMSSNVKALWNSLATGRRKEGAEGGGEEDGKNTNDGGEKWTIRSRGINGRKGMTIKLSLRRRQVQPRRIVES
jgi:hypothetical protein